MAINPLLQWLVNTSKTSATVVKKNTEKKAKNALWWLVATQKETMPQARAKALLPWLVKVAETTGKVWQANVAKKQEQAKDLLAGMTNTVNQSYIQSKDIALSDLTSQIAEGVQQWATVNIQKLKDAYPEIANADDSVLQELSDQIAEWTAQGKTINIDKLRVAYPELYELPKVQPKQTIWDKIIWWISKVAPIISPLAWAVQKIWAKNVLNAWVWALEWAASVGWAIWQWLAYLDPTITVDEYKRWQENIDATAPQPIQDIRGTQAYWVWKEAGKIWASTALTRPIWWAAKWVWLLWRAALWATEWVLWTAAYNVASGDEAFNTTSGIAWAIGGAIPLLWAWVKAAAKYAAPRLQLSWLLNPAKLNQVKDMLIDEWSELVWKMDTTDVWKWMIERWFKWWKDDIIKWLTQYSNESKKALDWLLASSKSKHNVSSAKRALENIRASYADTPWLESKFAKVDQLLSKDAYTLTELNAIKREMDDAYNLFKSSWGETAGLKAEWLRNIRKDIRKYIEDVADAEWLWNVKMLNNETSVSRTLADAVSRKDSADIAREMLSVFSKPAIWWALSMNQWPFNGNTVEWKIGNFLVWWLLAWAVFSTTSKTYMANALRWLSWIQKKELSRFIATKWAEKLSNKTVEEVAKITNAIKLLKEWPLDSNPLRLTTTPKTRTLWQWATVQTKRPLSLLTNNANTTDNIVNNTSWKVNKPRVNILAPKKPVQSDTLVSKSDEMGNKRYIDKIESTEKTKLPISESEMKRNNLTPIKNLKWENTWRYENKSLNQWASNRTIYSKEWDIVTFKKDDSYKIGYAIDNQIKNNYTIAKWDIITTDLYKTKDLQPLYDEAKWKDYNSFVKSFIRSKNKLMTNVETFKPLSDLDSQELKRAIWITDWENIPKEVTLYRWIKENIDFDIRPWDFLTKNKKIAEDFAKWWKVKSFKVKTKDLLWDTYWNEEVIYTPKDQLRKIREEANK